MKELTLEAGEQWLTQEAVQSILADIERFVWTDVQAVELKGGGWVVLLHDHRYTRAMWTAVYTYGGWLDWASTVEPEYAPF